MSIYDLNPPHSAGNEIPSQFAKRATLEWLVPDEIEIEMNEAARHGYDVSIGNSFDPAYYYPDKIKTCFDNLDENGMLYQREMGRFDAGRVATLTSMRFTAPFDSVRKWAKKRMGVRDDVANSLRSQLLYDKLTVRGQPWHKQGGKALALGTIVDAHELNDGQAGGLYETMSGRLTDELSTHVFSENAGWLAGLSLEESIIQTQMKFRNRSREDGEKTAGKDIKELTSFINAPVRPGFKNIVAYSTDSLGIRSRKEEVRTEINAHVDASHKDDFLLMSVGCGTALPMLEVVADLREKGKNVKLILLDQDPIALAAAEQFATQMGLEDILEIHCEQLFHGKGLKTHLLDLQTVLQGREVDVSEDSGLREYFRDNMYKDLTSQIWNALSDDGLMTTGNMNQNRPQPEFLHGLMGWPIPVTMRKMSDITRLHRAAGVPKSASRLRVTQEGVYTMCFSSKQAAS